MKEQVTKELCLVTLVKKQKSLMPAPIHFSHKILRLMAEDRKKGSLKELSQTPKAKLQCYMKKKAYKS